MLTCGEYLKDAENYKLTMNLLKCAFLFWKIVRILLFTQNKFILIQPKLSNVDDVTSHKQLKSIYVQCLFMP